MARLSEAGFVTKVRQNAGDPDQTEVPDSRVIRELNECEKEMVLEFEPAEAKYEHSISVTTATGAGPYSLYAGTLRTYVGRNSTSGALVEETDLPRWNKLQFSTSAGDPTHYLRKGATTTDPITPYVYFWPTPSRSCTVVIPCLVKPTEFTASGSTVGCRINEAFDSLLIDRATVRILIGMEKYEAAQAYAKLCRMDERAAMLYKRTRPRSAPPGKLRTRLKGLFT